MSICTDRQTTQPQNIMPPVQCTGWRGIATFLSMFFIEMTALKSDEKHKEVHTVPTTTLDSPLDYWKRRQTKARRRHRLLQPENNSRCYHKHFTMITVATTSCCSTDSNRPHRFCYLPSKVENINCTLDIPLTSLWNGRFSPKNFPALGQH